MQWGLSFARFGKETSLLEVARGNCPSLQHGCHHRRRTTIKNEMSNQILVSYQVGRYNAERRQMLGCVKSPQLPDDTIRKLCKLLKQPRNHSGSDLRRYRDPLMQEKLAFARPHVSEISRDTSTQTETPSSVH